MNLLELFKKHNLEINAIEIKDFGTIYRTKGLKLLELVRLEMFEQGHKTPVSCHREFESCEAFMIVWNK
jgi:hypothetical protein